MHRGNTLVPVVAMLFALLAVGAAVYFLFVNNVVSDLKSSTNSSRVHSNTNPSATSLANSNTSNVNDTPVNDTPAVDTNTDSQVSTPTTANVNATSATVSVKEDPADEPVKKPEDENSAHGPIKRITDISELFPTDLEDGFRSVNVMGDEALVGGGKYLYYYDGKTTTDISKNLQTGDPSIDSKILLVGKIANNGSYWLISTTRVGERVRLYSFDGKTWTDLSASMWATYLNPIAGGLGFSWNGSYWLIANNPGHLLTYDGKTFTDITSQIPNPEGNATFMDLAWNGSYFLFVMLGPANHGRVYKYDGTTITRLTDFDSNGYITTLGWNGDYWLIAGFNGQNLLKYDGTTITDLKNPQRHQATVAWVKKQWLVSGSLFDGQDMGEFLFAAGYGVSVGRSYGIALQQKTVTRFDF